MSQGGGHHNNTPVGYPTYASHVPGNPPLSSPSAYAVNPAAPHPNYHQSPLGSRPPAHQLQHPDHAGTSPGGPRGSTYASPQLKSFAQRSQNSSPEPSFARLGSPSLQAPPILASPLSRSYSQLSNDSPELADRRKRARPSSAKKAADLEALQTSSREASAEPSTSQSASKDQKPVGRVAKACQPCSTKKRRCDGRQPECSVCQVLGTPCTYNHTGLKRGPPKGFRAGPKESARAKLIRALETTVRDLVNHLGKDDAGSEIIRVTTERELGLGRGTSGQANAFSSSDLSRIKSEDNSDAAPAYKSTSRAPASKQPNDEQDEDTAETSEEDVIGETRMGEFVYRGSSSGIGILQRQHRGESPAPQGHGNPTSNTSGSAQGRSRLESGNVARLGPSRGVSHHGSQQGPVFLPMTSPRTSHPSGAGDTPSSSITQSPKQTKASPRSDGKNPYPSPNKEKDAQQAIATAGINTSVNSDPVVSKEENERLFRYYWQGFHPFWPILYKPWMTSIPVDELRYQLEPCLLYSIYAIAACIVPGNAESREDQAETVLHDRERAQLFCDAAERHVMTKHFRPDLPSIQACWLLGLYSHGLGDLSRAWNFQNLAASMAVDLGLHRWPIYRPEIVNDPTSRETRIRIIWHCYIMDKLLCAEMGRPVGLKFKDCIVPLLSEKEDDEFELWSDQKAMQPAGGTREADKDGSPRHLHAPSCLNWGIHLFHVVERILEEVHSMRRKALLRRQGKQKILAELDRQLTNWKETLPEHLHLEMETREGPLPSFFALNIWYPTARLLLHRPFIPQEEGLSLAEVLSNDSHKKSTEAANTICDLLEKSSRDFVDRLSTDLGYCIFTAAVMFVFNARLPDPQISSDARRRYGLCKQWLKKLADTWPAASAHRLLLDGFALVGEDASKSNEVVSRRPSVAALNMLQQQQAAGSNVSNWIAETDAATKNVASMAGAETVTGDSQAPTQMDTETAVTMGLGFIPAQAQVPMPNVMDGQQAGLTTGASGNEYDFAPGIFDVESFYWNENAALSALQQQQQQQVQAQMQMQQPDQRAGQQQQQHQQQPQPQSHQQAQGMGASGPFGYGQPQATYRFGRGYDVEADVQSGYATSQQQQQQQQQHQQQQSAEGLGILAQVTEGQRLGSGVQGAAAYGSNAGGGYSNAIAPPPPNFGVQQGGNGSGSGGGGPMQGNNHTTNANSNTNSTMSPYGAFVPPGGAGVGGTNGNGGANTMGDFWSMFELPPAFL